jgi:hypothetical protein
MRRATSLCAVSTIVREEGFSVTLGRYGVPDPELERDMRIDCDECWMQNTAQCEDCVVTFLLGTEPGPIELADGEQTALGNLAQAGLVPPLRLAHNPRASGGEASVSG